MKEEEKKDTKVDEENCDDFSFTDTMVCSNCKYYDPETNSCSLKSTDFQKFSVNPNNHCIDWEQDDSFNIAYNLIYKILDKYMDMDDKNKRIVSLWVLGANIHNSFQSYPYLFINAMKGCLPKGTLIKTPNGDKAIEEIKEVLSYNFNTKKIEPSKAILTNVGLKKVIKIHLKDKIIECSPEHRWFVKNKNGIELKETKDLNTSDNLILIE